MGLKSANEGEAMNGIADRGIGVSTQGPLAGLRVLVADDDRIPRRIVSSAVARAGGETVEAEDGAAVLAIINTAVDAVVLDFVMPGMDGADLVRALRVVGFSGPVVGYSGSASEAQQAAWIAAGCDEVLPKGCAMTELVTELAAAYRRRANSHRRKPR
jgi:two-component system OmpR family response regulator